MTPKQRKAALLDLHIDVKARQPKPIPDEDLEPIRKWRRAKARRPQK